MIFKSSRIMILVYTKKWPEKHITKGRFTNKLYRADVDDIYCTYISLYPTTHIKKKYIFDTYSLDSLHFHYDKVGIFEKCKNLLKC